MILHHRITQGATQAIENRRAQQERLDLGRLLLQHLFQQIIHHEMMRAGERLDEAGRVRSALQRQRPLQGKGCQLQAGDPPFGAGFQRGHVVR